MKNIAIDMFKMNRTIILFIDGKTLAYKSGINTLSDLLQDIEHSDKIRII